MKRITTYARSALALILGERCVVCGAPSIGAGVCPKCLLELPYINIRGVADDMIERLFWATVPIERASSMLEYTPHGATQRLLESIKYKGRSDLAVEMGRMMGEAYSRRHFFDGIDCIQPVPLHPHRRAHRGYNQSEELARGIAEVTSIPVVDVVRRTIDNVSQTTLTHTERFNNVKNIFTARNDELQRLHPRHVLFVDDVITTGSTLVSCIQAVVGSPEERSKVFAKRRERAEALELWGDEENPCGQVAEPITPYLPPLLKVSVLSLAYAGRLSPGFRRPEDLPHPTHFESNAEFRERQYRPNYL